MVTGFSKKVLVFVKNSTILLTPSWLSGLAAGPIKGLANLILFKKWLRKNRKGVEYDDYFKFNRIYDRRLNLYAHVLQKFGLDKDDFTYLEFGVSKGHSFRWWLENANNPNSEFYGFDTFEGLPESWGSFKKGDMIASIPDIDDPRAKFVKGLFQDTLYDFIDNQDFSRRRTIIHLDADLFSATVFVLTTMHRHLKKGDILLFDEFNVPNHEFEAFRIFEQSFNFKYQVVGAVNNYFQVAIEIL